MTDHATTTPPQRTLKDQLREFLGRYRHPNAVNGQDWTEADVERLAAAVHRRRVERNGTAASGADRG